MIGVELLHGQSARRTAPGECLDDGTLQPVMFRVVVNLAQQDVPGAHCPSERFFRRNDPVRPRVPDPAGERVIGEKQLAWRKQRAGGEEECAGERAQRAQQRAHTTRVSTGLPEK